jgi:GNAT superfamily N-acetyltransferase
MSLEILLREPATCSETERRRFERLVRLGFDGSDDGLVRRILDAHLIAFAAEEGAGIAEPAGIAGLKRPPAAHRENVFRRARAGVAAASCELELGWVFVPEDRRGRGIATRLCRSLLDLVPGRAVYATTRPENAPMIRVLSGLGFVRKGEPFPRRHERLALFLRVASPIGATPDRRTS